MAKVRSRVLVIDASIATAAGETSMHPTSRNCRAFLQSVLSVCHRMVLTNPIQEEWNAHQSAFARRWRTAMMARKKIEWVEISPKNSLEKRFAQAVSDKLVAAIIEKDRHIVEASLAADQRIASLDDRVRSHLKKRSRLLREVASICWINPNTPVELAICWLESGAPADRFRTLGLIHPESDDTST